MYQVVGTNSEEFAMLTGYWGGDQNKVSDNSIADKASKLFKHFEK